LEEFPTHGKPEHLACIQLRKLERGTARTPLVTDAVPSFKSSL